MSTLEVSLILFPTFIALVVLRVPVAFALGLACVPVFMLEDRLTPILLMNEMFKSYNAFVLLAVPFFVLAGNLMNATGITERIFDFARALFGAFRGGLAQVNVAASMICAGTTTRPTSRPR